MLLKAKVAEKLNNFFGLQPAESPVRDEAPNLKPEAVIMCCMIRTILHLRG
jgi:hypothetical protein